MKKKKTTAAPAKTGAAKDIYAMRKRKKRRRVLKQSIWLLLLAVTILVLYQRRDSWIPKLETIGVRHQSRQQGAEGDTDGNFPIHIYGDRGYQLAAAGDKLMLLSDPYLYIYEQDGNMTAARQHTYGNAMLRTAGDYGLLYENGGTHFRLETPAKVRFEKTLPDPIVFGRVSPGGLTAIVTGADTCACRLLVFNAKGQQIYERSCVERLAEIAFYPDEKGCFAVRLEAQNGVMKSVVSSYSFSEINDIWSSQPLDMLAISVYNTIEGDLFILGDTRCCFLDAAGTVKSSYTYPDSLVRGIFSGNMAALLLGNDETRSKTVVVLNGPSGSPALRTYEKDVMDIGFVEEEEALLVQLRSELETLSYQCSVLQTTPLDESCDGFLRIGQNLYLQSFDRVDRMEYRKN